MGFSRAALVAALGALLAVGPACSVTDLTSGGRLDGGAEQPQSAQWDFPPDDAGAGKSDEDESDAADAALVSYVPPPMPVAIQNLLNKRNLDVANGSLSSGAQVYTWSPTGATNQLWTFRATDGGTYQIVNQNSGSCVDVPDNTSSNGTRIQQYLCWYPGPNQQWELFTFGTYIHIVARASGKCLASSTQMDGAEVYIWDCSEDESEQWAIVQ